MLGDIYTILLATSLAAILISTSFCSGQDIIANVETEAPAYSEVPRGLSFTCQDKIPGYYADVETRCQVWHWCIPDGGKFSFLCPNGTVFNQNFRVCDWWFNVDCASAVERYSINEDLYKTPYDFKEEGT